MPYQVDIGFKKKKTKISLFWYFKRTETMSLLVFLNNLKNEF
jgi:hypothetical protein